MLGEMLSLIQDMIVLLISFEILVISLRIGSVMSSVSMCGRISIMLGFMFSVCMVLIFLCIFIDLIEVVSVEVVCFVMMIVVRRMFSLCRMEMVIRLMIKILVLNC